MKSNSVTYAKAIAIMLMVLSHARFYQPGQAWISMFHMPLFFMMSGYCFKDSHLNDHVTFLKRRTIGVYWPLVKWSIVFVLLHNMFCTLYLYSDASTYNGIEIMPYSIKDMVSRIMSVIFSLNYNEQLLGGYWFLRELFLGYILFYVFVSITRHRWYLGGGGIIDY